MKIIPMKLSFCTPVAPWVCLLLALWAAPARGSVSLGDKPDWALTTINNQSVTPRDALGRVVVMEFWATWCGPCMKQIPHIKKLHSEYAPKGVAFIGVSLDNSESAVEKVAKSEGMTWPLAVDKGRKTAGRFGVTGIPQAFILGPEGQVLWIGHPGSMEGPLADAVEKFPYKKAEAKSKDDAGARANAGGPTAPQSKAEAVLRRATRALDAGQLPTALKLLTNLQPADLADPAAGDALSEFSRKLIPMVDTVEFKSAADRDPKLAAMLDTLRAAATRPPAQHDGDAANAPAKAPAPAGSRPVPDSAEAAHRRLEQAVKLADEGKHVEAYEALQRVAKRHSDTPAGRAASDRLAVYHADEAFMEKLRLARLERDCVALNAMADSYLKADQRDRAIAELRKIIDRYPETPHAKLARERIDRVK